MKECFKSLADLFNPNLTLKDEYKQYSKEELDIIIKNKLEGKPNDKQNKTLWKYINFVKWIK